MKQGDTVEDFTLTDDSGTERSLTGLLKDGPVVLFFYPKADSMGCTKETCYFRDLAAEFAAAGAQRVGISMDSVEKQQGFGAKHSVGFPLLSDPDGAVAAQFGRARINPAPASGPAGGRARAAPRRGRCRAGRGAGCRG